MDNSLDDTVVKSETQLMGLKTAFTSDSLIIIVLKKNTTNITLMFRNSMSTFCHVGILPDSSAIS